jgi:FkbH-like protein
LGCPARRQCASIRRAAAARPFISLRETSIHTLAPPEVQGSGADATSAEVRVTLEATLRGSTYDVSPQRTLAALALAAPEACLRVLCEPPRGFETALPAHELSHAISSALGGFAGSAPARRAYAVRLVERYGDRITASAATDVVAAFGTLVPGDDALLAGVVHRFPGAPAVLRVAVALARARGDATALDDALTQLGLADRTTATAAFVQRLRPARTSQDRATIRAALLSSFTIDALVPHVDLAFRALHLEPELYVAPFNSWMRDIVDDSSGLRRFAPDIVFLSVSLDDLMPQLSRRISSEEREAGGAIALERVLAAARHFVSWSAGKPLVVHSFTSAFASPDGVADGREGPSRTQWLAQLNATLADELRALPGCYPLDLSVALAAAGAVAGDNPKLRHLAAMRLPPSALPGIADAYARYVAPLRGLTRKCVVLDLDDTLWGGVVGEDGAAGLRLGPTSPGSEFVEFQEYLRSLTQRGILLAINSKNNPDDALGVLRTHAAMVLREGDFSAVRINWDSKPENMRAIAAELNIGLDSLVFIDDNPDERERMRQLLPEVLTVELPRDPALYRATLERLPQLQTLAVTADDRARVENYHTLRLREQAKSTAPSVEQYLASLGLHVRIAAAQPADAGRIVQLFAKTNQFNTTTKRYDASDVARFIADPGIALWVVSSRDRFGEHGLIALTVVRTESPLWTIDSFLMSCRVIGYGIESVLLAFVAERARENGAASLAASFVPTSKNAPARELFAKHGFTQSAQAGAGAPPSWEFSLTRPLEFPAWIARSYDGA